MGVVFRAREPGCGRIVALKRLLRGAGSSAQDVERFQAEAMAAAHLAHPHIVPVFQVGEHEGQPFFTMQYIDGTTLARRLADGPMPGLEAARLLGETHHAGVLENWGQLWIYHSVALLVFFGATNALHLAGVTARWPYVLLFTAGLGAWAALFWALRRQGGPISFVERQLAHVRGSGIVAINLVFLVEWLLGLPVLSLITMIAVTNGMLFMVKAGILSGFYYFQAAAVILAILPMAWFPRFAPMIFGTVAAACFFVTGLKYRLRRQRSEL